MPVPPGLTRPHVLVLGGTTEARALAAALDERPELRVTTSLAGRVKDPAALPGAVRVGGFGGAAGLAAWLGAHRVDAVVDATHPFAADITAHAGLAAAETGVPLAVLRRPGWEPVAGDQWRRVPSLRDAARALAGHGREVFLTTGRTGLAEFSGLDGHHFLVRAVEPPEPPFPRHLRVLLDRGPYTVHGETELLRAHRVDVLVTKDSGGAATGAKLAAARALGVPVLMVDRPALPGTVRAFADLAGVLGWLESALGRRPGGRP
ncbi:cobalt-precorrin-6A reductase [Streptomyces tsukubensis]|uniref:Cobalt-precorrin-6A reductase n=1 Tax=Streptomyces tsukubensis TaxID=83656 RepID=A0A1V4AEA7_9ACTN|nr:cobalt-precorrin-6A reductase [Streptomyces tsukubensis]OON81885.1 cobalt-precorrin-6A reductase [Streptomyces tsukubensis]QFR96674.1 cobalt-precorrin-6A reductase [Streptomyces tsukubensis]